MNFSFHFRGLSQDLCEVIMTMVNNATVVLSRARQQPTPSLPPSTPQPPPSTNPTALTPNPMSTAGTPSNIGPPGPAPNAPISNPGMGGGGGMPPISAPSMGMNNMGSTFGNIGGVGPIGGGLNTIGSGPIGGGGPIGAGARPIGGTPISSAATGMAAGLGSVGGGIGAIGGGSNTGAVGGVKPGPMGMPAVMQGLQNNPLGNPAAVVSFCLLSAAFASQGSPTFSSRCSPREAKLIAEFCFRRWIHCQAWDPCRKDNLRAPC